jgi:hypothetical protein
MKTCKWCGSTEHTSFYCFDKPRKPIKLSVVRSKPLRDALAKKTSSKSSIRKNPIKKSLKPVRKSRRPARGVLVRRLDAIYSQYIRLSEPNVCVTCGEQKHWKELQNGHFYSRGRYATRWEDLNCHPQCARCNVFLKGNYINYTRYMIDRFGREAVDQLEVKSKSTIKISTPELEEKIEYYKKKVKELNI